jgi:hypothetical protein
MPHINCNTWVQSASTLPPTLVRSASWRSRSLDLAVLKRFELYARACFIEGRKPVHILSPFRTAGLKKRKTSLKAGTSSVMSTEGLDATGLRRKSSIEA